MSEAIISRRGRYGNNSNEPSTPPELQTRTFYSNTTFTIPNYRNGGISVRIFGGGGSGGRSNHYMYAGGGGGGGGQMNNATIHPIVNETIQIAIGEGGVYDGSSRSGGTSSFGGYLSAIGGEGGSGNSGGNGNGGSGGGSMHLYGGNGGK